MKFDIFYLNNNYSVLRGIFNGLSFNDKKKEKNLSFKNKKWKLQLNTKIKINKKEMQVKKNEKVYYDARKNARNAIENGKRQKKRKKKDR